VRDDGYAWLSPVDSERVERALAGIGKNVRVLERPLEISAVLRRELGPRLGRIAAEQLELRARAARRFPAAWMKALTRKGLEQATRAVVARARAARIAERVPGRLVYDATCGLGADSIALAERGQALLAGDLDPTTARCARINLAAFGAGERVVVADAGAPPLASTRDAFWLVDPDRRAPTSQARSARSLDPSRWSPNAATLLRLCSRFAGSCWKLAPGVDISGLEAELPPGVRHLAQWVSAGGELCELALWIGEGVAPDVETGEREAVLLEEDGGAHRLRDRPITLVSLQRTEVSEFEWLAEPDAAVLRAGLVGNLARDLDLLPLARDIAFLGGARRPESPFVRAWRVLGSTSSDPRRVRELLGRHDFGPVRVLKRGHPDSPEELARRYRGPGRRAGLVAVLRLERGHAALVLDPQSGPDAGGR
jgi:SAM-dependent methyltransferase